MIGTDSAQLYQLYCRFTEEINQAAPFKSPHFSKVRTASYQEFSAAWNSLTDSRRKAWRLEFEAGYEGIANAERLKLLGAFLPNRSTQAISTCLRAA
jgi:hypothetical protein